MKLHRSISLDRPLLVVALEEEAQHLHLSTLPLLVTGVGKVAAAAALSAVLARQRPSRVINLGAAGSLAGGLIGTHVIGRVFQHDFDDRAIYDLTGFHSGAPIDLEVAGPVLASGDVFVNSSAAGKKLAGQAALVDMEGYAVAYVAGEFGLPVTLVKDVSEGAGRSWPGALDQCAERLGAWLSQELSGSLPARGASSGKA